MRTALALATALAGSVVGIAAMAAPAHAESCTPPHVSGFTFHSLVANGISCHEAQHLAAHTTRHGAPSGWTCTHRLSGRNVSHSCHETNGGGRTYHFSYSVH